VRVHRELDGPPGRAICEEAQRLGADLVVMATHGRGATGGLLHCDVAVYVVRHLRIPVLLVHPAQTSWPASSPLRGILVALDHSEESKAILDAVQVLALLTRAPVTLMHVIVGSANPVATDLAAKRLLERVADRLRGSGVQVSTRVTLGLSAATSLRDALEESQFDLLAMATHGSAGLKRLWMGSVTEQVVRTSSKPLLVLGPPTTPEAAP
jgi:nucleotide-binding universal stress UspA family protein